MGPEDKNVETAVCCNGQPVEVGTRLPEIIKGTEGVAASFATFSGVCASFAISLKEAVTALAAIGGAIVAASEFCRALHWAEAYNRPLAHRYRHTKKERIRKKYRKRILSWYRAEVIGGGD